ncbi:hypothetical protein [Cytobacillus oceanisediminis]|uniref:hypothetical protein n=1 Tax=Cytobacillus oceanisediminis TaxID=665099 RepID=UPI0011A57DC2
MNLWESKMPTKEKDWVGSLTIPRILKLDSEGHLQHESIQSKQARDSLYREVRNLLLH